MIDNRNRVLFGITTKSHVEIGLDEMYGMEEIGYVCDQFEFGGRKNFTSAPGKLYIIFLNAVKLLKKAHVFKPDFIYLNSRLEYAAGLRDFITIIFIKLFYYKKVYFLIKSHGSDLEVLKTKNLLFKNIIFPFLNTNVQAWLFLSSEELKFVASNTLLHKNRLFLAKNIVRVDKFHADNNFKERFDIRADYSVLIFVGRFLREKGIHYVVEAFAAIRQRHKVVLILVGDGEEFTAIQNKIARLDIENDVILTGWVEEEAATYYTANSDVLIFPTFFPEGFPMALFNSIASGLAILTTPTRAAIDYLQEPHNCLWVLPKSSSSVELALEKILSDDNLMLQMRQNNKQKAQIFTRSFVSNELSAIFNFVKTDTSQYYSEEVEVMQNV